MQCWVLDVTDILGILLVTVTVLLWYYHFSKEHLLEQCMQAPEHSLHKARVTSANRNLVMQDFLF